MADSKTLTVTYGTFACELEGFDDPFPLMKRVVSFYKRMSVQNPDFAQYGEMEKVDGLVQAVLNVTGAEKVDLTTIQGGVRIVNMDGASEGEEVAVEGAPMVAHDETNADEFEYSTPVEETESEVAEAENAPKDVEPEPVVETTSEVEIAATSQDKENAPEPQEDLAPEAVEEPMVAAAEIPVEEEQPQQEVAISSEPEVVLTQETIPEVAVVAKAEVPQTSSILRLGDETPEHAVATANTFIDDQIGEETSVSPQHEEPLLQAEPEPDLEDDLAGTFANAMQRPSAGATADAVKPPQPTATPEPEALILGDPVAQPQADQPTASAEEPKSGSTGRRLGLSSLKVPGLGALLKSGDSKVESNDAPEASGEPAPLQLTPSLKVSEKEEAPLKPKSVSETVAERAEENSRRRLRIIRNEELPIEELAASEPTRPAPVTEEKPAEPVQVSEVSKPAAVEPMQLANAEPAEKPVAPVEPVAAEPAVAQPQPLQLAEVATPPAPAEKPVKAAAPKPAPKVEEPVKHDPSNEIANKLHASITAPPESSTQEMIALANTEFVDDGEMNFRNFVFRLGASTLLELMEAAAVYISLVENQPTFERKDIMQLVDGISDGQTFSPQARIKSYGKLVRSGQVLRLEGGAFALAPDLHANYQEQMAL